MVKSINRLMAELVTPTGDVDNSALTNLDILDSADVISIANNTSAATTVFDTLDSLPTTGLSAGQQAFVNGNNRLYISNGTGWYNLTFVNRTPTWAVEPDATYEIADSQTPLIVTARATDSDNSIASLVNQSVVSDSAQYMVNISNDSSVWTFTPKSADSIGIEVAAGNLTDSNGDFVYTFKWTDGINFVSKASTISYSPSASQATSFIGLTSAEWTGSSPSPQISWPVGTQAGDTAILIVGFSGYGSGAPNETALSGTSGWTLVNGTWGANTNDNNYAAALWHKTLSASDVSSTFAMTTTEMNVYTYGVWDILVVRNAQSTVVARSTDLGSDTGSNGTSIQQASGLLPSGGSINVDGLLIDVQTTRSGTKTWNTFGNFNMEGYHDRSNIIAQVVYTIPYSDYVSSGYSRMQTSYNMSSSETYGSHSFVISV